jgi:phenylalanyl-tRNA synthetase beta chain
LHPKLCSDFDVKEPVVAFELYVDALPLPKYRPTKVKPDLKLSDLQPVTRDFAFLVPESVPAQELLKAITAVDRTLITNAHIFDRFKGTGVPDGFVSLGVEVTLQPQEKTLTDEDLVGVMQKIIEAAGKKPQAVLRGG